MAIEFRQDGHYRIRTLDEEWLEDYLARRPDESRLERRPGRRRPAWSR